MNTASEHFCETNARVVSRVSNGDGTIDITYECTICHRTWTETRDG